MLPSDPAMLLSVINLKLRDFYPSLNELCKDLDENEDEIKEILATIGYHYDVKQNRYM